MQVKMDYVVLLVQLVHRVHLVLLPLRMAMLLLLRVNLERLDLWGREVSLDLLETWVCQVSLAGQVFVGVRETQVLASQERKESQAKAVEFSSLARKEIGEKVVCLVMMEYQENLVNLVPRVHLVPLVLEEVLVVSLALCLRRRGRKESLVAMDWMAVLA